MFWFIYGSSVRMAGFAQNFGDMVGTYEGHFLLSECRWGGDPICRWWGHLNTILQN